MTTSLVILPQPALPAANWTVERQGQPIDTLVFHHMAGTFASADRRFRDPTARVSAQYGVLRDGRVVRWVADGDTAYHAGDWSVNLRSIGIEHEDDARDDFTDPQYESSALLVATLRRLHPITRSLRHRQIVPTACPGALDVERILARADWIEKEAITVTPMLIEQSPDLILREGEVGSLRAVYDYGPPRGRRTIERKVYSHTAERRAYYLYPPADPDADPTETLDAEPAIFLVDVTPL